MKSLENNREIAEFMGLSYRTKYNYTGWYKNNEYKERICDYGGLKYHSDWNWLMQVVEKIESLGYYVNITGTYTSIGAIDQKNILLFIEKDSLISKIEAVYNACISFIDWYNLNK